MMNGGWSTGDIILTRKNKSRRRKKRHGSTLNTTNPTPCTSNFSTYWTSINFWRRTAPGSETLLCQVNKFAYGVYSMPQYAEFIEVFFTVILSHGFTVHAPM